jgi:hypothetical protein
MNKYLNQRQQQLSFAPLVLLGILALAFDLSGDTLAMFSLGYIWNWGICNEKIYSKINTNSRYRFSFLRLYSKYGEFVLEKISIKNNWLALIARSCSTLVVAAVFYAVSSELSVLFILAGGISFESFKQIV